MSPLTPKLIYAGFFGLMYTAVSYLFLWDLPDAGRWAAISGLTAFGLLLLLLLLNEERRARRFSRAEKQLPGKPEHCAAATMRQGRKATYVQLYLYRDELILLNADRKEPVITRIPREKLRRAEAKPPVSLALETTEGLTLALLCPALEELLRALRDAGWFVSVQRK